MITGFLHGRTPSNSRSVFHFGEVSRIGDSWNQIAFGSCWPCMVVECEWCGSHTDVERYDMDAFSSYLCPECRDVQDNLRDS